MEVKIALDLFCDWVGTPPVYRLYVDNCLLTERTYIWHNSLNYVKENIIINVNPGPHTLRIERVNYPHHCQGNFRIRTFYINDVPEQIIDGQFIIR